MKTTRLLFIPLIFTALVLFTNCSFIKFTSPQPLKAYDIYRIPDDKTGYYVDNEGDTLLIVYPDSIKFNYMFERWITFQFDDPSVLLRKKGHWYVLNVQDSIGWYVFPARVCGNKIKVYQLYYLSADTVKSQKIENLMENKYHAKRIGDNFLVDIKSNSQFFRLVKSKVFAAYRLHKLK